MTDMNIAWTGLVAEESVPDDLASELTDMVGEFGGWDLGGAVAVHDPLVGAAFCRDKDRMLCVLSNGDDVVWLVGQLHALGEDDE